MAEYWLVSAPGDPTPKDTWDGIKERTETLSLVNKFTLPDLKVFLVDDSSAVRTAVYCV